MYTGFGPSGYLSGPVKVDSGWDSVRRIEERQAFARPSLPTTPCHTTDELLHRLGHKTLNDVINSPPTPTRRAGSSRLPKPSGMRLLSVEEAARGTGGAGTENLMRFSPLKGYRPLPAALRHSFSSRHSAAGPPPALAAARRREKREEPLPEPTMSRTGATALGGGLGALACILLAPMGGLAFLPLAAIPAAAGNLAAKK